MSLTDLLQDQNPWWRDGAARRARRYPVRREIQRDLLARLGKEDRRAILLLGPRQVGKTILLLQLADDLLDAGWPAPNLTYFDFADERLTEQVTARSVTEASPVGATEEFPRIFLFDEIRSAPRWDLWLKQAVDHRVGRIVATDSAARLLRQGTEESGQGRWDELAVEGLSFREFVYFHRRADEEIEETLTRQASLHESYLAVGGFPEHALSTDFPESRRRLRNDIVDRAVERDLARTGVDVGRAKELFAYLTRDSGAEFNAEARGRDLEADPRSARDWLGELVATRLVVPLERRTLQAAAKLRSRSKIYAADPGLVSAFALSPIEEPDVRSRLFEAAVFRHLRSLAAVEYAKLGYFRLNEDLEIDFVLETNTERIAIEVTSTSRLRREKVARLHRAAKELGETRRILVYGGVVNETVDNVEVVALPRFLLDADRLLGSDR